MFKKNKNTNDNLALELLKEELKNMEELSDGAHQESYIQGMAYMAFMLGALHPNVRAEIVDRAHAIKVSLDAKGKPVYKKVGVYTYKEYLMVKVANKGDGAQNWSVQDNNGNTLATDLTFKEASKKIEEISK